jgi:hypothetical protein
MLDRGYKLGNIAELLGAWEDGQDIGALLGFEAALAGSWYEDDEPTVTADELAVMVGLPEGPDEAALAWAIEIGIIEPERGGDRYRVVNPSALEVAVALTGAGVPLDAILSSGERMRREIDDIALQFVDLVDVHVVGDRDELPDPEEMSKIAGLVDRLRPLSKQVVDRELSRAMERQIRARFGERIEHIARNADLGATGDPS